MYKITIFLLHYHLNFEIINIAYFLKIYIKIWGWGWGWAQPQPQPQHQPQPQPQNILRFLIKIVENI